LTSSVSNQVNSVHPVQPGAQISIPIRTSLVVFLGLLTAEIIATVHVHVSNLTLYDKTQALKDAGYLIVPNSLILPSLTAWKPAVLGGLFFTLSLGVFLTLLSLAAAWFQHRVLQARRGPLLFYFVAWLALLFALNIRGLSLMSTLYALVIPPLIFSVASHWLFRKSPGGLNRLTLFHILSPLLLALLWSTQLEGSFFGDVRDYLLLSHSAGTKINDFYYRYTLYPAEAFKSLDQKLIKAVFLENLQSEPVAQALERELLAHDYLTVSEEKSAEIVITGTERELHLQKGGVTICSAKLSLLLPSPAPWLADFSARTDHHRFLREFTFFSLLVGFPLFLYILLYGLVLLLLRPLLSSRMSSVMAALFCLLSGILLFVVFFFWRGAVCDEGHIAQALQSPESGLRVAALKLIDGKGLEIARYPAYRKLLNSPSVPERCWLAKALGASRRSESFNDLLSFLDDPHPAVVTATYQALGKRRNPAAVPHILMRIETSKDWYNQWNAYKALRALGWKQCTSR
jgi:hypothetical protein